jgi:Dolichyl-phosphate-mannose-protein mannosyltransferase
MVNATTACNPLTALFSWGWLYQNEGRTLLGCLRPSGQTAVREPLNGLMWLLLWGVLFLDILMQVNGLSRSFWLNEVWVANSILEPTFSQMVYYEGWLNTNPPLFLLLVRFVSQLLGISHATMRLIPFLFGVLSIFAMAYLALRLLEPWYALLAILLFSLSPDLVLFAKTLKPYTGDTFVSIVLLIVGYRFLTTRSRKLFIAAIIAFCLLEFLSYQAIIFLPIFLCAASSDSGTVNRLDDWRSAIPARWLDIGLLLSCASVASAINYFYFVEPNRADVLVEFWKNSFYHGSSFFGFVRYSFVALAQLTGPFFFLINPSLFVRIVVLIIVIAGLVGFFLHKSERPGGSRQIAILLGLPVVSLAVLNLLGQYPISRTSRLLLFIFPVVTILFASGIQVAINLCARIASKMKISASPIMKIEGVVLAAVFVGVTCLFVSRLVSAGLEPYIQLGAEEDSVGAMRYLSAQQSDEDLLYIHSTMREHYKFYSRSFPINGGRIVEGNIGWPCCPRGYINDRRVSPDAVIPTEFARLEISGRNRKVRLLFTDRQDHWNEFLGRDEPHEFEVRLSERGCFRANTKRFKGIRIEEYTCGAGRS